MKAKALKQKGFTLIELLVVVVIIGILASVAVPNFMGAQDKAKNSGVQANTHNVQMALEQYAVDNAGVYPDTETNLETSVVKDKGYMAGGTWPKSPWGSQQNKGIAWPTASESAKVNETIGGGTNPANLDAVTHYGAVSYSIASGATARERYNLVGSGKKNNSATVAIYLKNY